jgi:hypothetical protein
MNITETIEEFEQTEKFQSFQNDNDHYLVHAFTMHEGSWDDWQLGYYSKEKDKVVVFELGETVTRQPEDDVLKEEGTVAELAIDAVEVQPDDALDTVQGVKDDDYPHETVGKTILILQDQGDGPVYNVTLVTDQFSLINVKVNAISGDVKSSSKDSIMDLGSPMDT